VVLCVDSPAPAAAMTSINHISTWLLLAVPALASPQLGVDPCSPNPCGPGANCAAQRLFGESNRVICTCPRGWKGDPTISCDPECLRLSDCPDHLQCQGVEGQCIDPCTNDVNTGRPPCGVGADCKATRHKAICSCPRTHTGDPFVSCRPFTAADLCNPDPCGRNAFCEPGHDKRTGEERPVCLCNEGFTGNGVTGCVRGECTTLRHDQCPDHLACYDSTCIDPCSPTFCGGGPCCSPSATCRGVDHKAECSCPPGYEGEPRLGGECRPCRGSSCNRGATGSTGGSSGSLCDPNPCGLDAICNPGSDNTGRARPVCTCPKGYSGNALVSCRRGECFSDSECPRHLACFDYKCSDPCAGVCGSNADCQVRNHGPVCACPAGFQGDPISHCFRSRRTG